MHLVHLGFNKFSHLGSATELWNTNGWTGLDAAIMLQESSSAKVTLMFGKGSCMLDFEQIFQFLWILIRGHLSCRQVEFQNLQIRVRLFWWLFRLGVWVRYRLRIG